MNERDESLLLNIQDDAEFLLEMSEGYDLQSFLCDEKMKLAVSMLLIKIGESVKSLSKEFKEKNQEIEWRDIAGLRDIVVHNYGGLGMERIWRNVTRDVPELLEQMKSLLHDKEVEEGE
jgi:uncharacterized protein with HEPN domain